MKTNANLAIPNSTLRLGDRCSDPVTGFVGILTCHSAYLTGCQRVTLCGPLTSEGQTQSLYADLHAIELVKADAINAEPMRADVPPAG